jgi:hypothetical protein
MVGMVGGIRHGASGACAQGAVTGNLENSVDFPFGAYHCGGNDPPVRRWRRLIYEF